MESKAKLLGHPIHNMLIVFPLGLLATSIVFDLVYLITKNGQWAFVSFWMIVSGIVGGLLASPFGLVDWLAIPPGTRAKTVGAIHGLGNVGVLLLFGIGWLLRMKEPTAPDTVALGLSGAGFALSFLTGWLGGELVNRLRVGVDDDANLNAPNSLASSAPKVPSSAQN